MSSELTAYANTGIVALRAEPSDAAEMVTQFLMGETLDVLHEQQDSWIKVRAHFDGYQGWVNRKELEFFEPGELDEWLDQSGLQRSIYHTFRAGSSCEEMTLIPVGTLAVMEEMNGAMEVKLPHRSFEVSGDLSMLKGETLLDTARGFLGTPYLWGGRTDVGVDCSGLVQMVFALHGYRVPRDSGDQYAVSKDGVMELGEARPGDLIYFNPQGDKITHVGFYAGNGAVLHASGNVHIASLDRANDFRNEYPLNHKLADHIYAIQRQGSLAGGNGVSR